MESSPSRARDSRAEHISGFVLAGGHSARMGRDKVLLPWQGGTLLTHAANRLRQVCDTVQVCSNRSDLPGSDPPIPDALPESGPLGGIVAALERSHTSWNLFLAVDLPLVPVEFLHAIVAREQNLRAAGERVLCIVPKVDDLPQPLCALYHRDLTSGLRDALTAGKHKMMHAIQESVAQLKLPSSCVDMWDIANFDAARKSQIPAKAGELFLNINTPMDWWRAQELASKESGGAFG